MKRAEKIAKDRKAIQFTIEEDKQYTTIYRNYNLVIVEQGKVFYFVIC